MVYDKDLINTWEDFFQEEKYYDEIERVSDLYPEERSLIISYWDLLRFNEEFCERVINDPKKYILNAEKAIKQLAPADTFPKINFRLKDLPPLTHKIPLADLRTCHMDKLVAVEGIVRNTSVVRPRLITAVFRCEKCGQLMEIPQNEPLLKEPMICLNENCNRESRTTHFTLLREVSEYIDLQLLSLQEPPENIKGTSTPQRIRVFVRDDLCGKVVPGERVTVNGLLLANPQKENKKVTDFDLYIETLFVEQEQIPFEEINITSDDENEIQELSKNPMIFDLIKQSIAPTIFEMDEIKEALTIQLFGGIRRKIGLETTRGDIHILLIGDPSTGKSQLLKYISKIAPRAIYASGLSSSKSGLTAAAIKDELDGTWTLEGGALVLANKGIACIDEMEKMRKEDRSSMHEAMEQQQITINKAGIHATLRSRCSILAGANPKGGRFTKDKSYVEQINLSPTLLSRFDLIFPLIDEYNEARDDRLVSQILGKYNGEHKEENKPSIEIELLKKYIAYAKRNVFPEISDDVKDYLKKYYLQMRKNGVADPDDEYDRDTIELTLRQLEGLIRISEGSARVRLSNEVTMEDCKRAERLFQYYLNNMATDNTGKVDIDIINTGKSRRKRDYQKLTITTINQLINDPDVDTVKGAHITDITKLLVDKGMQLNEVDDLIERLNDLGFIFSPHPEHYMVVQGREIA